MSALRDAFQAYEASVEDLDSARVALRFTSRQGPVIEAEARRMLQEAFDEHLRCAQAMWIEIGRIEGLAR